MSDRLAADAVAFVKGPLKAFLRPTRPTGPLVGELTKKPARVLPTDPIRVGDVVKFNGRKMAVAGKNAHSLILADGSTITFA